MLDLHKKYSKQSKIIRVVNDQKGCPTDTINLANVCLELINQSNKNNLKNRIFHWSNEGIISWYDFALSIGKYAEEYGLIEKAAEVEPIKAENYKTLAKRPKFSALDCMYTSEFLNIEQVNWEDALKLTLKTLSKRI